MITSFEFIDTNRLEWFTKNNPDDLRKADAIEIVVGQGAKPGGGGMLLGQKISDRVAEMRNFSELFDEKGYGDGFITTERFLRSVYKAVALEKGRERDKNKRQTELLKKNQERAKKMDEKRSNW